LIRNARQSRRLDSVGLKPSAVAIVMVASDDQLETTRVANLLADKISYITIID
jgi:hypothetical protein